VYWTDTPDGHLCSRHDFAFKRGEVCHQCITDPPPSVDGIEQDESEVAELRARVSDVRSKSRTVWRRVTDLLDGTDREIALGLKALAEYTKLERLGDERQNKLDEYVRDDRLIRREREMAGIRH
jgi:hypothetical protein